jgi:UDP-glucuronate decarboxylase
VILAADADPRCDAPDIALAQKLLGGWTPRVPLERGLEATIAYFRGRNGGAQG